uniref:Uncharacterized protein n=1 Tax=Romanomermis culicivorax TaxID=13658 RepID=A0A915K4F0_ROMCU
GCSCFQCPEHRALVTSNQTTSKPTPPPTKRARPATPEQSPPVATIIAKTETEPLTTNDEPMAEMLLQPPAAEEVVMSMAEENALLGMPHLEQPTSWAAECFSLEELRLSLVALEIDLDTAADHKKPDLEQQIQQLRAAVDQREKEGSTNLDH